MFTARDFVAVAEAIRGDISSASPEGQAAIFCLTLSIADKFAQINPRFDRARFYDAAFGEKNHFLVRDQIAAAMRESKEGRQ